MACACLTLFACDGARNPRAAIGAAGARPDALYVSTGGSDRADGRTPQTPLRTIGAALKRVEPGMTIFVEAGTYYEQISTRRGGEAGREITLTSYGGTATIDGSRMGQAGAANQNRGLVELLHPYVRLLKLNVVNSRRTGVLLDADHLTVEGCDISRTNLHAISTNTNRQNGRRRAGRMIRDIRITQNTVHEAVLAGQGRGQAISLIADGFSVNGNTVFDNLTEGIDIWLGATRGEVSGNTVYNNRSTGIYVDGASYVRISGNKVYRNRAGIGVSSEDVNYDTHDIWVYNNLAYDNADAGCYIWDERQRRGYKGSQNVLIAHNTLVGNRYAVYLAGEQNTGEIANNLGYSTGQQLFDNSSRSSLRIHDNVWLRRGEGFVAVAAKDFRLAAGSPAIDKGGVLPVFGDDAGGRFTIDTDYSGARRLAGARPDAGAYEYR